MNFRSFFVFSLLAVNITPIFAKNSLKFPWQHRASLAYSREFDCNRELSSCEFFVGSCMCLVGGLMLYDALKDDTHEPIRLSKQEMLIQLLEQDLTDLKNVLKGKASLGYTSLNNYGYAYTVDSVNHLQGTAVQAIINKNNYLSKKVKSILESTRQIVYALQHGYNKNTETIMYHKKRIARNLKKAITILDKAPQYPMVAYQNTKRLRELVSYFNETQSYW